MFVGIDASAYAGEIIPIFDYNFINCGFKIYMTEDVIYPCGSHNFIN